MKTRHWIISLEVELKYVTIKHSNDYKTCNLCLASLIEHQKRCLLHELSSALNPSSSSSRCSDLNISVRLLQYNKLPYSKSSTIMVRSRYGFLFLTGGLINSRQTNQLLLSYYFFCCSPLTFLVDTLISRCKRLL